MRPLYIILFWILTPNFIFAQNQAAKVNQLMDDWHMAAAQANFNDYFGAIHQAGRFLGTDATERWTKVEFSKFSKPFFDKGKAWDFKPKDRIVFIDVGGKYAWFDEVLDTWMGPCRGSGILMKTTDGWKIMQYNLAILVANGDVSAYLELIGKENDE